jgi:hypothetical protein
MIKTRIKEEFLMYKTIALGILLAFSVAAWSQAEGNGAPEGPPPQAQAPDGQGQGQGQGQVQGQWGRGHRFQGVAGTITAINGNSIEVKTRNGSTAQVTLSDKTQYRKNSEAAKLEDFKVGDEIFVRGQSSGEGAWQADVVATRPEGGPGNFREGLGKQFIVGEIKSIDGAQLTIARPDGVTQTIAVDENTSFRKDNESITLADLKPGDHVFGRGEVKNDLFVAAVLNSGQPRFMGRRRPDGKQQEQSQPQPQ